MNSYDDLQRFKEKTQTLDIAFKDMSGQSQEAEQGQWSLLRQLTPAEQQVPFAGQRIDVPQPQPINIEAFTVAAQQTSSVPVSSARGNLLESLVATLPSERAQQAPAAARSLFPPPQSATPAPVAAPVLSAMPLTAPAQPVPVEAPIAVSAPQPAMTTPNTARGALFRSRVSEPVSLSKETLLKPLLEKIALCH